MTYPTDTPEERKITEMMAKTFHHKLLEKHIKCIFCGKIHHYTTIGLPLNEYMIRHYQIYHAKNKIVQ